MKLRLKPLRGQTYKIVGEGDVTFLGLVHDFKITNAVYVLQDDSRRVINIDVLRLPIIDTKDYEKIEDTKYKGD